MSVLDVNVYSLN